MGYSKRLGPPIVSAAVATIALTGFTTVTLVQRDYASQIALFNAIWPIILTSTVAVILVMSFLHRALGELVGEIEAREVAAQHQALHDQLSGLPNRTLLEHRLDATLRERNEDGSDVALLMLDLDGFKRVNDTLGHSAGDELVQQVAARLSSRLWDVDTVARIGGDEFAVILVDPENGPGVSRICERISAAIEEVFCVEGKEAHISVSIGAVIAENGDTASELLRKADITMYQAKADGRGCYRVFSSRVDAAVQRRTLIEEKLRHALHSKSDLGLHYQPQFDAGGQVVGAEALLRWDDSDLGTLTPDQVIPIAEDSGLIRQLGDFVLERACEAAREFPRLRIAVNLSPTQFRDPDLATRIKDVVRNNDLLYQQFELEITESLTLEHSDLCRETIQELRDAGFRIALDDFGTGYSSLSYLRQFQVDTVKLDRSFIESAQEDESIALVRAAVTLGHALKLRVVAEGISTSAQERIALEADCDVLQGNYFAPALTLGQLSQFLSDERTSMHAA